MSEGDGGLQFDKAETAAPVTCGHCRGAVPDAYFELNGQIVCPACRDRIGGYFSAPEGRGRRAVEATLRGMGGGFAGAALYAVLIHFKAPLMVLAAIAVGWLVGVGVRKGAQYRGGIAYQLLAVGITYFSIVSAFAAAGIVDMLQKDEIVDGTAIIRIIIACTILPFLVMKESPFILLIIGFALWQAGAMNRRPKVVFNGPFQVATRPPLPPAAPA